jgi:hypothetical protein
MHHARLSSQLTGEEYNLNLAQMQALQMVKIEELFLYLIELKKQIEALKSENQILKKLIKQRHETN